MQNVNFYNEDLHRERLIKKRGVYIYWKRYLYITMNKNIYSLNKTKNCIN